MAPKRRDFALKMKEEDRRFLMVLVRGELNNRLVEVAKEVCGTTKGGARHKETWWWNRDVEEAVSKKKEYYNKWQRERTRESRDRYVTAKRNAKKVVAIAKNAHMVKMEKRLDCPEYRNEVFRIAKQKVKEGRDITNHRCLRRNNGQIVVDVKERLEEWRKYVDKLLNHENDWNGHLPNNVPVEGPVRKVETGEVRKAVQEMKNGKAAGPSGVNSEMLKIAEGLTVEQLTKVANSMLEGKEMPTMWKESLLVPLYKGKGDALKCSNYRSIKLLDHAMKVVEKVFERRLRSNTELDGAQFGFQGGRGTTDAIFIVRQMIEKFLNASRPLYLVFIDLEKAFDHIPRSVVEWAMRRKGVTERDVQGIMAMYKDAKTRVKIEGELSESFQVKVGVHQGSVLSPWLFNVVMDEVTREARSNNLKELLYADDLLLMGESLNEIEVKYRKWKEALHGKGLKINVSKTRAMIITGERTKKIAKIDPCTWCGKRVQSNSIKCKSCNGWVHKRCSGIKGSLKAKEGTFSCRTCAGERIAGSVTTEDIVLDGDRLLVANEFCYLGDMLSREGGSEAAVSVRISAAWHKFRELSSVLCTKGLSNRMKGVLYKSCVRPAMTYGGETWATKTEDVRRMCTAEMRMLRMMCGVKIDERRRNDDIRSIMGVESVEECIERERLRWFGHVMRRSDESELRQAMRFEIRGEKRKGRPKKTWVECVRNDMKKRNLPISCGDWRDRKKWRSHLRGADSRRRENEPENG